MLNQTHLASSDFSADHLKSLFAPDGFSRASHHTELKSVGVIGGGTAGYITALCLKKAFPALDVTVVASSKIPVIGVGEATTPLLPKLLHRFLGLDVVEFYEKVRPTWKLGIRFDWGKPGDYYFNYPFEPGDLVESLAYESHINGANHQGRLMSRNCTPFFKQADGTIHAGLHYAPFAYHMENRRFVAYLEENLAGAGIKTLDRMVVDADVSTTDRIDSVITEEGDRLSYDMFIDCTGFRSVLLKKLGAKFVSFKSSLLTNVALTAKVPNHGFIKPYTTAKTMDSGWCWVIPHDDIDHIGYVHCSDFCDLDSAEQELRAKFPGIEPETKPVHFRSGRHDHFWHGNVVAVGNAYGFVEPLESTAIHVIIEEANMLVNNFPETLDQVHIPKKVNDRINNRWDQLRGFLAIHYKFNKKLDTPFWRFAREEVDLADGEQYLHAYQESAPLGGRRHRLWEAPECFDDAGYDTLLMGQEVPARMMKPKCTEAQWRERYDQGERILDTALTHAEALEFLAANPDELRRTVGDESATGNSFGGMLEPLY